MRNHKLKSDTKKFLEIEKLRTILIRKGNKERSFSFYLDLCLLLKSAAKTHSFLNKNIHKSIEKVIYTLGPGFLLRNVVVAGRVYRLPVPISPNRQAFLAATFLKDAAFINTKNPLTVPELLLREIINIFKKNSEALKSLQNLNEIAVDQRPFSRYLRKKRRIVARARKGYTNRILVSAFKKKRKSLRRKRNKKKYQLTKFRDHKLFMKYLARKKLRYQKNKKVIRVKPKSNNRIKNYEKTNLSYKK